MLKPIEMPTPDAVHLDPVDVDYVPDSDEVNALVESISPSRMAWRRFRRHRVAVASLVVFGLIALIIVLAPITTRYGEIEIIPPFNGKRGLNPPGSKAWFGTDELNRDIYSRIIWGGRVSLFIG